MTTLIERLKAASGPDRELDAEIAVAIGDYPENWNLTLPGYSLEYFMTWSNCAPAYTASLDAAMTLRDRDNWPLLRIQDLGPVMGWHALIGVIDTSDGECRPIVHQGEHATPALALVIACLMARGVS
jgi:hypothetical protein